MTDKYQAGEAYADNDVSMTGLYEDLRAVGMGGLHKDAQTLISVFTSKGKPADDREMTV
jgi:hypothetical protein